MGDLFSRVVIFVLIFLHLRLDLITIEHLIAYYIVPVSFVAYLGRVCATSNFSIGKSEKKKHKHFFNANFKQLFLSNSQTRFGQSDKIRLVSVRPIAHFEQPNWDDQQWHDLRGQLVHALPELDISWLRLAGSGHVICPLSK